MNTHGSAAEERDVSDDRRSGRWTYEIFPLAPMKFEYRANERKPVDARDLVVWVTDKD